MEADEFDALYTIAFSRLVNQLYALVGDREEARDCVQEAFVRAWSRRRELDGSGSPEAWVRLTAYRLAVSRWRHTVRSRRSPDRALQPVRSEPPPDEARIELMRALSQLPVEQRHALVLHHLCDLPVAEVAVVVRAPVGTVKARLSRGRATLHSLLAEEGARHV
ncbi:sigma-70 family RNA polymerase sigma factor [Nocardioides piscis]|uniref:Sigma-70 family RNA polymerase sigma factor n=1 Tax=Nocardioides piscis TaxID=2714938 RepID=A0A6G7YIT5_9ACTN|nr:sigma-70 family RNA polymerase sigma factor [Nocardioides piscis]QIK76647.1 sigma-70 family RNA polymerase sigma factor [Nocardioides piscis]